METKKNREKFFTFLRKNRYRTTHLKGKMYEITGLLHESLKIKPDVYDIMLVHDDYHGHAIHKTDKSIIVHGIFEDPYEFGDHLLVEEFRQREPGYKYREEYISENQNIVLTLSYTIFDECIIYAYGLVLDDAPDI